MTQQQPKKFQCSLEVRGYELDSFGHVNHATYISYLEHARWKMLAEVSIGLKEFQEWKRFPVIAEVNAKYRKPTFLGESLEVRTEVVESGRVSFTLEQRIFRAAELVFEGRVKVVLVDETGRPAAMPEGVARLWT